MSTAGLCLAGGAARATVTLAYDPGTTNYTTGLTGFQTDGADMTNMTITAWFSGPDGQTTSWTATGSSSGSASVAGWFSLSESGDTFSNSWTLRNLTNQMGQPPSQTLTRLLIDAGTGDTVFDISWGQGGGSEGTPGSASGRTFSQTDTNDSNVNVTATYRDLVALTGQSPVGDLYRKLDLTFSRGLDAGSYISFIADTDNLKFKGDLQPVPEPTTLVMAGALLGLTGVTALRRKKS